MYDPVAEKAAVESRARDGTRLSDGNVGSLGAADIAVPSRRTELTLH